MRCGLSTFSHEASSLVCIRGQSSQTGFVQDCTCGRITMVITRFEEVAMICPHCGAQLSDGSTFCTNCGTRLDTVANTLPKKRFCTSCGAEIPAGSSFCVQCGAPVAGQPGTQGQGNPAYRPTQASAAPAGQTAVRPPLSVPYGASQSTPQMAQATGGASQGANSHSSKHTVAIVVACIAVVAVVGVDRKSVV